MPAYLAADVFNTTCCVPPPPLLEEHLDTHLGEAFQKDEGGRVVRVGVCFDTRTQVILKQVLLDDAMFVIGVMDKDEARISRSEAILPTLPRPQPQSFKKGPKPEITKMESTTP